METEEADGVGGPGHEGEHDAKVTIGGLGALGGQQPGERPPAGMQAGSKAIQSTADFLRLIPRAPPSRYHAPWAHFG